MFERSSMISVGERLAQERIRRGFTIEEVSQATKIQPKFLLALEQGEYKKFPSSAYIQGFVKNYTDYLGLPSKKFLILLRREFNEKEYQKTVQKNFAKPHTAHFTGFRFQTTTIAAIFGLFFICGFVLYQYRSAFTNPTLTITSPKENARINAQIVSVIGKTDPNAAVTINDAPAYVDSNGNFKKDLQVFAGNTTITAKAVNRFQKKSIVIRHINVATQ